MSFASLLRHQLVIRRRFAVLDGAGDPTYDGLGQPVTQLLPVETWRCRIEPKDAREMALLGQAGAAISDHTIYGFVPTSGLRAGDQLVHADGRTFEVQGTPDDAGGEGHHLEVDAQLILSADPEPS